MFLDQDQMYLRMCNVNKEKISLENSCRSSSIDFNVSSDLFIVSTFYLFDTIVCAQFSNYLNVKKKKIQIRP